jgi:MFS family permease
MKAEPNSDELSLFSKERRLLSFGLLAVITLVAFEALAIATVMPLVEAELSDVHLFGWVFSAFFSANLLGIVIAGDRADSGRLAPIITVGLLLFCLGLYFGGAAGSMTELIVARGLQGFGAGVVPPAAYVCIARGYPGPAHPRMMAVLSTAWLIPAVVGPASAIFIAETFGWRWVFWGLLPITLGAGSIAVTAVAKAVDARPAASERRRRLPRALTLMGGVTAFMAGLSMLPSALTSAMLIAGLIAGVHAFRRLTPEGTLVASPGLPALVLLRGLLTFAFFGTEAFVPLSLVEGLGMPPHSAGIALTACALTWMSGAWVQAHLIDRLGPRRLIAMGFALLSAAIALVALPLALGWSGWWIVLAWALSGAGMGAALPSISVTVLAEARRGAEGEASAALQLTDVLGMALGTGMTGAVLAWGVRLGQELDGVLPVTFAIPLAIAMLGMLLSPRTPSAVRRLDDAGRA